MAPAVRSRNADFHFARAATPGCRKPVAGCEIEDFARNQLDYFCQSELKFPNWRGIGNALGLVKYAYLGILGPLRRIGHGPRFGAFRCRNSSFGQHLGDASLPSRGRTLPAPFVAVDPDPGDVGLGPDGKDQQQIAAGPSQLPAKHIVPRDRNAKTLNGCRYGSYRFPPPFA